LEHQKLIPASSNVGAAFDAPAEHCRKSAIKKNHRLQELDETIAGDSQVVRDLKNLILRAADSDSTVLITGESGTGKELIARSIHDLSPRRDEPFSAVNCGALTESLLESELFGHVKGAFTGANTYKKGLFEAAGKGTIFLDEFGEMSSLMQVRLLRVLQQRRVRPVGSEESKEIEIHARVVVATNRNLKRDIAEGRFRQDLYYRVNVFPIRSPALRNHIEDLPVLIDGILKKLHANSRLAVSLQFDTAAVRLLSDYSWPGNVRELENVIERLANNTMQTGVVSAADVKIDLKYNGWSEHDDEPREIILSKGLKCLNEGSVAVRHLSRRDELELYLKALDESEGDLSKAARRLGIKRTTLYMRIKRMQHNLDREVIT
jgi:sigma-54 dependent transcriptional regulator, flagellar regulatory protein